MARAALLLAGVLALAAPLVAVNAGPAAAATTRVTFDYTGKAEAFTVPAGAECATIDVFGAQAGGDSNPAASPFGGGPGGHATVKLVLTPGEVLTVYVGGRGGSRGEAGFNGGGRGAPNSFTPDGGGGGGGASDIRRGGGSLSDRVLIAGGGGGKGGTLFVGPGALGTPGGVGGGLSGGTGETSGQNTGGSGGDQAHGGTAGGPGATSGALAVGGNGGVPTDASGHALGGGGGGGLFGGGGGGGGPGSFGGGGGGGSGAGPPGTTFETGVRRGDGLVSISWIIGDRSCLLAGVPPTEPGPAPPGAGQLLSSAPAISATPRFTG
jgi:hypothetical protein